MIFESFQASSLKVRNDYAENLKGGNYVGPLLDFTFDVLGHTVAQPLNLDKGGFTAAKIASYDLAAADAETEEKDMQWLLVHLCYLALKYAPGLFKSWYLDCKSKQTRSSVESWITKYLSPIITAEALDDVQEWADAQGSRSEDEMELFVKVSKSAREVIAGYEVDEFRASIAIKMPTGYPMETVTVVGLNRVAVTEKKWQSWLLVTQGVIAFSVCSPQLMEVGQRNG